MLDPTRLITPGEDGGVLVEPEGGMIDAWLRSASRDALGSIRILDVSAGELRAAFRARLSLGVRVVATGHQAEFYHTGVFAKVIATDLLGRRYGATPIFMTVDSDMPRSRSLVVPQQCHHELRLVNIPLSDGPAERIALDEPRKSRADWMEVFAQAGATMSAYEDSALRPFSAGFMSADGPDIDLCDGLARGRRAVEDSLGLDSCRDLTVSQASTTPEFLAFAAHLLLDAAGFADAYNAAQESYRRKFGVRARNRPVPPLLSDAERVESPFWLCRLGQPRQRMFVTAAGDRLMAYAGDALVHEFDAARLGRVETAKDEFRALEGWRLFPRALTLSCFARLVLADVFFHGTGGARYDEMTDGFARRYWGAALPPAACVTATLRLPLEHDRSAETELSRARWNSRDVRWNPQRHLRDLPPELRELRERLVARSSGLRRDTPADRVSRRIVFSEIRATNDAMLKCEPWRAAELDERVATLEHEAARARFARDREYFYGLHSVRSLALLVGRIERALAPGAAPASI